MGLCGVPLWIPLLEPSVAPPWIPAEALSIDGQRPSVEPLSAVKELLLKSSIRASVESSAESPPPPSGTFGLATLESPGGVSHVFLMFSHVFRAKSVQKRPKKSIKTGQTRVN